MHKVAMKSEGKLARWRAWVRGNWQVLLFWFACAFAGWYLGAKGYGMTIYFRLTGINPEEWTPLLRLTAQKDPKVGTFVSLEGLTDWQGRPVSLPFKDRLTAIFFVCGRCGLEESLNLAQAFQDRHAERVRVAIVYIGQPDAEFITLSRRFNRLLFLFDPKLKVFEHLNALYMPRLYLIGSDGTLQYLSSLAGYNWRPERWREELERLSQKIGR